MADVTISMRVEGGETVRRNLRNVVLKELPQRCERGLIKAGLLLQHFSMEIVPLLHGPLRASAKTTPRGHGYQTSVVVSYDTEYAVIQHENLDFAHAPGRQAKYLEAPMRNRRRELFGAIVAEVTK